MTANPEGLPPLPELWPHQKAALDEIEEAFGRVNVVALSAPVGAGKSILGEAVRRRCFPRSQTLYICSSIYLQEQLLSDPALQHAKLLMGKSNYRPHTRSRGKAEMIEKLNITCDDCTRATGQSCSWCDEHFECPYYRARQEAMTADLAILNMHYWLAAANHIESFKYRYAAIVDECDLLDQTLSQFAEVVISARTLSNLKLSPPPGKVTGNRTTAEWSRWLHDQFIPRAKEEIDKDTSSLAGMSPTSRGYLPLSRRVRYLSQLVAQVKTLLADLPRGENCGWVRVGRIEQEAIWRPIWPTQFAKQTLWSHATKWLLMSGTVLSAEEMMDRLGLDVPYEVVNVPSPIHASNRPIVYLPAARLSKKSTDEDYDKITWAIRQLCDKAHPHERVIVHTVSYDLTRRVVAALETLPRYIGSYTTSAEVFRAIEEYKSPSNPNAILVAPSLERGFDLPGDLGRASIIAKCPYPNLGDAQISARLYSGGQSWFDLEALRRIIQMSGRTTRGIEDFSTAYILDRSFYENLWKKVSHHVPLWWKDAINFNPSSDLLRLVGILPTLPGHIASSEPLVPLSRASAKDL